MKSLPGSLIRREVKQNQSVCPKCKSTKIESFDFSFSPRVLVCKKCGYEWELPYPKSLERVRRKFIRMMNGNLDW